MPFTPPANYASKGNTGYEAIFQIGSSASPPVYTPFLEIKSIALDWISMTEVPLSHLQSPLNTEEFAPSMIKPGKVTVSGNFIGSADQLNITTLAQAQTIFPFQCIGEVQQGAKTYTGSGRGFVSSYKNGPFENNKAIEFQLEIQMTGAYTEVVA